ncbi:DNA primase large subunit-like [Panulirus ornatus]|uniref:DNA primase large subunit-like n=1 Tax=Panulirus ornatus TaxID=150431 RepID=UPI003A839A86
MVILEVKHLPLLMNIQALHYKCIPYRKIVIKQSDQKQSKTCIHQNLEFQVPFIEALELVRQRKVYLSGGYAYVPDTDLVTLVLTSFRTSLSHALAMTSRALPQLEDDERLMRLLQDFDKRYTGSDYLQKKSGEGLHITPDMIDELATKSFPLCMRQLHDILRREHHLRHGGRLTYGLFLKAAGLTLEDALYFWRSHFTKNMDVDKFEKQYAYNIRFNYGKEGKRTDYTPYSCMKIIMTSIGTSDEHGCPFKHIDNTILRQRLISFRVPQQGRKNNSLCFSWRLLT